MKSRFLTLSLPAFTIFECKFTPNHSRDPFFPPHELLDLGLNIRRAPSQCGQHIRGFRIQLGFLRSLAKQRPKRQSMTDCSLCFGVPAQYLEQAVREIRQRK